MSRRKYASRLGAVVVCVAMLFALLPGKPAAAETWNEYLARNWAAFEASLTP